MISGVHVKLVLAAMTTLDALGEGERELILEGVKLRVKVTAKVIEGVMLTLAVADCVGDSLPVSVGLVVIVAEGDREYEGDAELVRLLEGLADVVSLGVSEAEA